MEQNGIKQTKTIFLNYIPIFFIIFYRLFISRFFFGNCRFIPSCSEYSLEAFRNFGFFKALKVSFYRILKCHPIGSYGFDPLIINKRFFLEEVSANNIKKFRMIALYNTNQTKNARYKEDSKKSTKHYLLTINKKVVSGLTLIKKTNDCKYQIRGMFTLPDYRSVGYGSKLLKMIALKYSSGDKVSVLWCNARIEAINFYKKNNFSIRGKKFMIKDIGFHYRMEKML